MSDSSWRLRHADDAVLVVDKPAGMLAVRGRGDAGADNLADRLLRRWPDAAVVHRLDMATAGLMVFARGAAMQRRLSAAFEARRVDKSYVALVHGEVVGEFGLVTAPLGADWPRRPRQRVDRETGRAATTHWRVTARGTADDPAAAWTRLQLRPLTGRTHQLRVHLLAIGHPIVGDALYTDAPDGSRLCLHAQRLAFDHPGDGRRCVFVSEPSF